MSVVDTEPAQACTKCKAEYPASHFQRATPGGRYSRCEGCRRPADPNRKRLQATPDQIRRSNLQRLYGISPEQYDERRVAQDYRCAICLRHEDEIPERKVGRPRHDGQPTTAAMKLLVDHDHETDAIRGLLCYPCNLGIGLFQDRPDWMARAIVYITKD